MTTQPEGDAPVHADDLLASGNEAGTAPGDRRYRPDVEGLRAIAILLVVLFHYGVPGLSGGFVGVDVFFVISGFVITGLLIRERESTGRTSILSFYARRSRRILPAATLVIVVTVVTTYFVGASSAHGTAIDGRWSVIFLANVHNASPNTNALSPLANYWSLSVEEQFYLVYPALFVFAGLRWSRVSSRMQLLALLGAVVLFSYTLSIVWTASNERSAYYSTMTRAWELALGSLIALGTPLLREMPDMVARLLTWLGLGAILFAAFRFHLAGYPGWEVAIPVLGAAMVITGGLATPRLGAESLLALRPCQWLGKHSYSLYLWHWPVLIIAAVLAGSTSYYSLLRIPLGLLSLGLSLLTYRFVENPIRHSKLTPRQSVAGGVALIVLTLGFLSLVIAFTPAPTPFI